MFDHLESAHGVVSPGVVDKMVLQRLIEDAFNVAVAREIRIKADVVCLLDDVAEARKAAPNVKHAIARYDPARGKVEFVADRIARQEIALDEARMEFRIEFVIPFSHRVEEIKSGR